MIPNPGERNKESRDPGLLDEIIQRTKLNGVTTRGIFKLIVVIYIVEMELLIIFYKYLGPFTSS